MTTSHVQHLIFLYGLMMDPVVQKRVLGKIIRGKSDVLVGYKRDKLLLNRVRYTTLVPEEGGLIEGQVYKVSREELHRIDLYETKAYRRIEVMLRSGTKAWTYVK